MPKKPWWCNPLVWLGGAATTVVTGVLTGVLVNDLVPQSAQLPGDPSSQASTYPAVVEGSVFKATVPRPADQRDSDTVKSPQYSSPPLAVLSENPIHDFGSTWVFPGKYLLTSAQNSHLVSTIARDDIESYDQWFFARGGYAEALDMQLVVKDSRNYPIRILNMNVIKSCGPPWPEHYLNRLMRAQTQVSCWDST